MGTQILICYWTIDVYFIYLFIQIDFWKPDSATQVKPLTSVDFHVKAEDVDTVENFLEKNEFHYQ